MENLNKPPVWAQQKPKSKLKWWHIILIIVGIIYLINLITGPRNAKVDVVTQNNEPVTSESSSPQTSTAPAKWVEVFSFKGNGRKKSESFHLNGNDAKIMYEYKSDSPDIGVLYIYVVNKGEDIMKTGGIPEVSSSDTRVSDESTIQKSEGDYYLDVNAGGYWMVKIIEKQ